MKDPITTIQFRPQFTLNRDVSYSGIGIHTGEKVFMTFKPAAPNTGIIFRRTDLVGYPEIPAKLDYVIDTQRSTTIANGKAHVQTIEHVMAAIKAYQIDNLYVEVSSIEPPVGNGSSDVFVTMIEESGVKEQGEVTQIRKLTQPVYWSDDEIHIVALPHEDYKLSYTLNYPQCDVLKAQYFTYTLSSETFKKEVAPCRTFARYGEVAYLMDRGLIKGGSLDNAVIIKDGATLSKGGLFFSDEMVRHKVLDMIGDLSLIGCDFRAHIIAIRSGHTANYVFAKQLFNMLMMEKTTWQ